MSGHVKRWAQAPAGFFEIEAAGLRWLADAAGAAVAGVREVRPDAIVLDAVEPGRAGESAARQFGRALRATHRAGAPAWGAPPPGGAEDAWIGRQPMRCVPTPGPWGAWYVADRVLPYLRVALERGHVTAREADAVERACAALADGGLEPLDGPSRLHGDLWSGNVLFGRDGVVLIDPAAHGGAAETDLAMLALFGAPHLDHMLGGYAEAAGWPLGWARVVPAHQLHPLAVHAASHGATYAEPLVAAARATLALLE